MTRRTFRTSRVLGIALALLLAFPAMAQITPDVIYVENNDGEVNAPTTPETDLYGAGGTAGGGGGGGDLILHFNECGNSIVILCEFKMGK